MKKWQSVAEFILIAKIMHEKEEGEENTREDLLDSTIGNRFHFIFIHSQVKWWMDKEHKEHRFHCSKWNEVLILFLHRYFGTISDMKLVDFFLCVLFVFNREKTKDRRTSEWLQNQSDLGRENKKTNEFKGFYSRGICMTEVTISKRSPKPKELYQC